MTSDGLCCGFDEERKESSNGLTNTGCETAEEQLGLLAAMVVIVVTVVDAVAVVGTVAMVSLLLLEDA